MTPAEAQRKLGLSDAEMARVTGVHYMTWRKWVAPEKSKEHRKAPAVAERLLAVAVWMAEHEPDTWRRCLSEI